jgi:DNA-binding NarL/FixJ family response regulator
MFDTTERPNIVIGDDTNIMRTVISQLVSPYFHVVHMATNGREAIEAVVNSQPDVVILDILMPDLDGIEVTRRLTAIRIKSKILILTLLEDPGYVVAALSAGASGFVFKRRMTTDLVAAIEEVLAGRVFVSGRPAYDPEPLL